MTIRELHHNGHYWTAIVHAPDPPNGRTCRVDRRYGSWRITPEDEHGRYQSVLPSVAAALQARVRKEERRRGRVSPV